jgi:chemotaxis protein methyltransferase CheR
VRRQVCKRLSRRLAQLGLTDLSAYRTYLNDDPDEWRVLDAMCRVTISRFYRDRHVWDTLRSVVLPEILRGAKAAQAEEVRCWCAGCASGEEPYTLRIVWTLDVVRGKGRNPPLRVTATDSNADLLERAKRGLYAPSSLKSLPREWAEAAFESSRAGCAIRAAYKEGVVFIEQDIRREMPEGMFHLVFCRNLVFTYFDESLQRELAGEIAHRLVPGGFLLVGIHEALPSGTEGFDPLEGVKGVYIMRSST